MIKFVRLDYRLLHGQVVFSWTGHVGAQRIIVVDDDAANDEMKKSALLLSKPAGVRVNIFTVDKAIAKIRNTTTRTAAKTFCWKTASPSRSATSSAPTKKPSGRQWFPTTLCAVRRC